MKSTILFRFRRGPAAARQTRSRRVRPGCPPWPAALAFCAVFALAPWARATTITWIGGNADWVDGGDINLWNPKDEPDTNDDVIFNTANTVHLGSNNAILSLALSGGIGLDSNDYDLTIDGLLQLAGSGTDLTIGGIASVVSVDAATINMEGKIILAGGSLRIGEEAGDGLLDINVGGTLSGQGTVHLDDVLGSATILVSNDGTLAASPPGLYIGMPTAGTLAFPAGNSFARIDLDGVSGTGVVTVVRNQTLDLNIALHDAFSGDLNLFQRSTIRLAHPWSIDATSTVDIDNGALGGTFPVAASPSYIAGAAFTQNGGTITVMDTDGTLQFDAPFTQNGGSLVNNGLVVFNANSTIGAGAGFTMPGAFASLTVNAGVEVNIDQADFNADGGGFSTNVITVESGGILDLDLGAGADESLNGPIRLNGGELDVTTASNTWTIIGPVTLAADSGTAQINGEPVTFSGSAVTLGANAVLRINAASTLNASASFAVAAGATLGFVTAPVFNGASFTGDGILRVEGNSQVTANTTIGVKTFDWDWNTLGQNHRIDPGVTFTINSAEFFDAMSDAVTLAGTGSTLTVNGPAQWNMNGALHSNPAAATSAIVGGTSRVIFGGAINANSGTTSITSPVTFGATAAATVAAGATLNTGNSATFAGGSFTGAGTLRVNSTSTADANTTIAVGTFDWDGTGIGSLQSISDGVTFTINSPVFDDDGDMDDPLTIGGNDATLTVSGPASWEMKGTLTTNPADTGLTTIGGTSRLILTSGTGIFDAKGDTRVNGFITLGPSSTIKVAADALLTLQGNSTTLDGPASVSGAGHLVINSASNTSANTTIDVNTFDWDGYGIGSQHTINDGVTLTINSPVFDSDGDMDDPINLGRKATLAFNGPAAWEMKNTLTASPGAADTATVAGTSRMILTTATGIINANGHLTVSAPVSFGPSSQANVAATYILRVNGSAIYDGGTITGPGSYYPPLTNYVYSPSTISTANFDFDYGNWTLNGGDLTVAVDDYELNAGANAFDNTLNINDATLRVTSADATFVMDGVMNCYSTGVNPAWGGGSDPLDIGNDGGTLDAALNVTGTGIGYTQIVTPINFYSDADVFIDSGATLQLLGIATFDCVNGANNAEFTGGGHLQANRAVYFNEATTLNLTGGSIDLDGADAIGDTIYLKGPVVINVADFQSFGNSNTTGSNILSVNHWTAAGTLAVNLDNPADEWTLNTPGVLNLINDPTAAAVTLLSGSDANLNGYVLVTGDVRTTARVDLGGTVDIQTAGKPLRLSGGDLTDVNTLTGGTINGPGVLGADNLSSLHGFGTINADIDFSGSANLKADNGVLTVNGAILDVDEIGTNDTDGILDVSHAWDSAAAGWVRMRGGELRGGALTINNGLGINGFGLVSARVINNTRIVAWGGGQTLVVATASNDNDWDGLGESGSLEAVQGTLELRGDTNFQFDGTVAASSGGTVFANGFGLILTGSSELFLNDGTLKQSAGLTTPIQGRVSVGAGNSTLRTEGTSGGFTFATGSASTLTGNLQLDSPATYVEADADFGGSGRLINLPNRRLEPANTADLDVFVENRGTLTPGGSWGIARNDMLDYLQTATGNLVVTLNGATVGTFDRLIIDGNAQLAGKLQVVLGGGYKPALGDTLTILSATAGVAGTFAPLVQPAGMPAGLAFEVVYQPTTVQLTVVSATPFDAWINTFGIANPADRTKAANPDGDSLNNLGEFATDGNPVSGANTGKIVGKVAPVGGTNAMTLTLPVRNGTVADPADPAGGELGLQQAADGLFYKIQASDELGAWTLTVTELTGSDATDIQLGLPPLNPGWTYRTFRSPGPVAGDPMEFMRVKISD